MYLSIYMSSICSIGVSTCKEAYIGVCVGLCRLFVFLSYSSISDMGCWEERMLGYVLWKSRLYFFSCFWPSVSSDMSIYVRGGDSKDLTDPSRVCVCMCAYYSGTCVASGGGDKSIKVTNVIIQRDTEACVTDIFHDRLNRSGILVRRFFSSIILPILKPLTPLPSIHLATTSCLPPMTLPSRYVWAADTNLSFPRGRGKQDWWILPSSRTAQIWDIREGRLLFTVHGHEGAVSQASFSADGRSFASGGTKDRLVMVWQSNLMSGTPSPAPGTLSEETTYLPTYLSSCRGRMFWSFSFTFIIRCTCLSQYKSLSQTPALGSCSQKAAASCGWRDDSSSPLSQEQQATSSDISSPTSSPTTFSYGG